MQPLPGSSPKTGSERGPDAADASKSTNSTNDSTKSQSVYLKEHQNKLLWKIHRIVNTQSGEPLTRQKDAAGKKLRRTGLSAVVFRIHHAIGDGLSLIGLMPKLFNDE